MSLYSRNRWEFQQVRECNLVTFEEYRLDIYTAQKHILNLHSNNFPAFYEKSAKAENEDALFM